MLNFLSNSISLGFIVELDKLVPVLVSAAAFVLLGLVVFALAFVIVVLIAPFSVKKEIEEDQNTSLAIIIGSLIIGIALIISAAISGN